MQLNALFTLGFPMAPVHKTLTLLHIVTRGLIMPKARGHTLQHTRLRLVTVARKLATGYPAYSNKGLS